MKSTIGGIKVSTIQLGGVLTEEQKEQFRIEGFLIIKGLFKDSVEDIKGAFDNIYNAGPVPGFFEPKTLEQSGGDMLLQYPRIIYPHNHSEKVKNYMIDARVMNVMADLFGTEPLAAQSMYYFKPPGARGQALHQDNYYLKLEPGTCIAAWTAIDPADEENGGLVVVPRTNGLEIECPHTANPEESFTKDEVTIPEGSSIVPINMDAGDVLFFNGSVIHGSYPNRSKERFRRSFICHYADIATLRSGRRPLYRADGTEIHDIEENDSQPCGVEFDDYIH